MHSSTSLSDKLPATPKPLHIIGTRFLDGTEVLLQFSDGTSAIYEAEELEKLRPAPKYTTPAEQSGSQPVYAEVA